MADLKKATKKIGRMLGKTPQTSNAVPHPKNFFLVQPFMLPFLKVPGIRSLNRFFVKRSISIKLAEQTIAAPLISLATAPNACDFVGLFNESKIVYYCVDDYSEWPCLEKHLIKKMQEELIEKADLFFATADKLLAKLIQTGKPAFSLPHGVDCNHFTDLPQQQHELLAKIPKPIVGYFGLFDERSDQDLLAKTAKSLPDVSFVITGNIITSIERLKNIKNIYFTGPVPYAEIPQLVSSWEICMLPYVRNDLTDAINPLKIKEYIATGKPIISTDLPEVQQLQKWVHIGTDDNSWVSIIEQILNNEISKKTTGRRDFVLSQSWEEKAKYLLATIDKTF
jgi:glycosyltransferase involved in cell wall biosynthesis